jgi:hypothetical protein
MGLTHSGAATGARGKRGGGSPRASGRGNAKVDARGIAMLR